VTALRLYTDGSCYPPGTVGAWAWILVSEHRVASCSGKTPGPSNHQRCELHAAIEGLTHLVAAGIREVDLRSDSRHVVGGMSSSGCKGCTGWAHPARERGWRGARGKPLKNPDLWLPLLELANSVTVTWCHVPGHRPKTDTSDDARYNREVDALAVDARRAGAH
jgi:ribonuclease HI